MCTWVALVAGDSGKARVHKVSRGNLKHNYIAKYSICGISGIRPVNVVRMCKVEDNVRFNLLQGFIYIDFSNHYWKPLCCNFEVSL